MLWLPLMLAGQSLPPHDFLDILIVSDEVNPHGLSDADLMQPGDLSIALGATPALNYHIMLEIDTNDIELATAALNLPTSDANHPEVLIYFAHRIPNNGNDASGRQAAFVSAVEQFLQSGGGVIIFHHGVYQTAGKEAVQTLIGAQATGAVPWDTVTGQDVIHVGGNHFIGNHAINYTGQISYANSAHDVVLDDYDYFNNTPDERYPVMDFNSGNVDCAIETLFETNYDVNGNQHLLGYTKQCPDWRSKIFVYQPGEYQPNATSGNNFQILLNAIFYLSEFRWDVIFTSNFD